MTKNLKISLTIVGVFVLLVAALLVVPRLAGGGDGPPASSTAAPVRLDSHRLSSPPSSKVAFVEFLDFEREACRSVYPAVEQLRAEYGDRVTFVVRYFPLPSHVNAERAARAVEAASQQGRFEDMYKRMYETQAEWGEQQVPMDERFRGYAASMGLDMAAFDAAYDDPATLERINADVADGQNMGVQGTPTFFVNGEKLEPQTYQDLTTALDEALASTR